LQQRKLCDYKNESMYSVCKLFCVCHYKKLQVIFINCKKKPEQCVFATILRAWLQPEVICGCTMAGVFVVEVVWLFGYLWLQIWVMCNCNSRVSCDCKKRHAQCFCFATTFLCCH
jgi:hypothetical protein